MQKRELRTPPSSSWWVGLNRPDFYARVKYEFETRMRFSSLSLESYARPGLVSSDERPLAAVVQIKDK